MQNPIKEVPVPDGVLAELHTNKALSHKKKSRTHSGISVSRTMILKHLKILMCLNLTAKKEEKKKSKIV